MSTTQQQILSNLTALGFNTSSAASILNQIAQGVGVPVDATIQEIANSEAYILSILTSKNYGKAGYYTSAAKAFQIGYNLTADPTTGLPVYSTIDTTAQIVSQAAFDETITGNNAQLFLKIATLNATSGMLGPLTAAQQSTFQNYFVNFQLPGVPITIINAQPDALNFNALCTYYSTYDLTVLQASLATQLTTFQNTFPFNGEFFAGDLSAYIKANVQGIRDFYVYNTQLDSVAFSGTTKLYAGYFNFVSGITGNITYQPIAA